MGFIGWSFALCWVALAAGGVVKGNEALPADVAADNAVLEDYATNALLTIEERKIVALLERIEIKFETLNEDEKVEFKKKISNYQDRFASTLSKVETIPGMYGLNVSLLRTNLGIPGTEEQVEEIHEDFEDVLNIGYESNDLPDATVENDDGLQGLEVQVAQGLEEMARKAAYPSNPKVSVSFENNSGQDEELPEKTIDDLYNLMSQLVNLVMVQIMTSMPVPKPAQPFPPQYSPFPSPGMQSPYPPQGMQSPYPPQGMQSPYPPPGMHPSSYPSHRSPAYKRPTSTPNPIPRKPSRPDKYKTQQQNIKSSLSQSPYQHSNLKNLFAQIPPEFNEVTMNINYDKKKKRKRRQADASSQSYADWYHNEYLPYLRRYQASIADYERRMREYNWAQTQALPTNPFGSPAVKNPFYSYSKKAYSNFMYEQVKDTDPQAQYADAYGEWLCEKDSARETDNTITTGEQCWNAETSTCVYWNTDTAGCDADNTALVP